MEQVFMDEMLLPDTWRMRGGCWSSQHWFAKDKSYLMDSFPDKRTFPLWTRWQLSISTALRTGPTKSSQPSLERVHLQYYVWFGETETKSRVFCGGLLEWLVSRTPQLWGEAGGADFAQTGKRNVGWGRMNLVAIFPNSSQRSTNEGEVEMM